DLRVAQAELALADAKLAQAKMQVRQKVVAGYNNVEVGEATYKAAELKATRMKQLVANKSVSQEVVEAALYDAVRAKTALAAARTALDYLVGKQAVTTVRGRVWDS